MFITLAHSVFFKVKIRNYELSSRRELLLMRE